MLLELVIDLNELSALVGLNGVPRGGVGRGPLHSGSPGETSEIPAGSDDDTSYNDIDRNSLNGQPVLCEILAERHGMQRCSVMDLKKNTVTPILIAHGSGKCGNGTANGLEHAENEETSHCNI